MVTPLAPQVLADPIAVIVDAVGAVEPALEREAVTATVAGLAGGRHKRRLLAQALLDSPKVLRDGRSPAPRAIGDLLLALRQLGAEKIAPPACADCGKHLRTLQRRGQDWYCTVCIAAPGPCAACGKTKQLVFRDRQGQRRCAQCPPVEGKDPAELLLDVVIGIDPSVTPSIMAEAVAAVASRPGNRRHLAWAIEQRPELLMGAGAEAPIPSVLRLIEVLADAGVQNIVRPVCPGCRRAISLHRKINGLWLCRTCVAHSRAVTCTGCGAVREPGTRDEYGRPLCPACLINDPANHETCVKCGRHRPVSNRTADGPLCANCRPLTIATCSICGAHGPTLASKTTGKPWCTACAQRWAICSGCGQMRSIRGGTRTEPLCSTCTRPDAEFWRECQDCGETGRIHLGRCARCALEQKLCELLGDQTGQIRPDLRVLYQTLATTPRPHTAAAWLTKSTAPQILRNIKDGEKPLTHATLDELPTGKTVEHLRSVLVAIGTLPPRDEQLARLERWIAQTIAKREDSDERGVLHRYATWHVVRRLRGRLNGTEATYGQLTTARRNITAAIALLDELAGRGTTLATARQRDLDAWLADSETPNRKEAGNFIRWAKRNKLTSLDFAAVRWMGPTGVIDTETRWKQARTLLHDENLEPEDRVAGLLVLLYAQRTATISRLTLDHLRTGPGGVHLCFGEEPILLPEPLDGVVLSLAATRTGHATIGESGQSTWLFPGGQPGRPISAYRLGERLHELGIRPSRARSTALFQLATELPAAVLARMLGIHIAVAVAWQRASSGDWTNYAAEIARRADRNEHPDQRER
ncbi:hypothetical protein KGA66_26760 [Actinocrinis puniceicyclus]|uniref:Site-specific recombinase XerD n=1 Tax=Actinocrinis puniceicyclus TaxID=977794 RepID=A0A8J8BDW5_9ACTN|nr:hypothetical protein [Actinocrinis puniceicyclus]MBS2966667.1 hypothetical protein [Actinocrinis puniceicyclus]